MNGSGSYCPTLPTSGFQRRRRMPCQCQHLGKRKTKSTRRNGLLRSSRGRTTRLAKGSRGPSSTPAMTRRTRTRRRWILPGSARSGTTWARHPRSRRPSIRGIPRITCTTRRATSWTRFPSPCTPRGCKLLPSRDGLTRQRTRHKQCLRRPHRRRRRRRKQRSHTYTSHASPSGRWARPTICRSPHRGLSRLFLRRALVDCNIPQPTGNSLSEQTLSSRARHRRR